MNFAPRVKLQISASLRHLSSFMIITYDHHLWSSLMIITYDMIIAFDHRLWSSLMIITYDHHLWSSLMIITYDHHLWASLMIITYDHNMFVVKATDNNATMVPQRQRHLASLQEENLSNDLFNGNVSVGRIGSLSNPLLEPCSHHFHAWLCRPGGSQLGSHCLAKWYTGHPQ